MRSASRTCLVATFPTEHGVRAAAHRLRERGMRIADVYAPYPVPCLDELIGLGRSRLPFATLAGGLMGGAAALAMQFYMAVFDWPLDVGGKPPNSTLAFIPITFELTVLGAALLTAAAFLTRSRLRPGARPARFADGTTEDVFAIVLGSRAAAFEEGEARRVLLESGAAEVVTRDVAR